VSDIIPVFPLNTVLFPGMWLSLHIFEDRYKQMVADCEAGDGIFGVALIREGEEVGSSADPHLVGTLARISQRTELDGGRFYLQTQGTRRFRIVRLLHDRPYLQGEIEYIDPVKTRRTSAKSLQRMREVTEVYQRYLTRIRELGGQVGEVVESALDPDFLSWLIASTLIVAPPVRQEILEIEAVDARLERERELLEEVLRQLTAQQERGGKRQFPFSMN
jgi:Lon protease-like protein